MGQGFLTTSWTNMALEFGGGLVGDVESIKTDRIYSGTAFTYFTLGLTTVGLATQYDSIAAYQTAQNCLTVTNFHSSRPTIALMSPIIPSVITSASNTKVVVKSVPDGINLYAADTSVLTTRSILYNAIPNATIVYEQMSGESILPNSQTINTLTLSIDGIVSNMNSLP